MISLENQISQLGRLRHKLRALEKEERKLTAAVSAQMQEHGRSRIRTPTVEARLDTVERLNVSPRKLRSLLSEADFLICVSVSVGAVRRFVGERHLRRIATIERSERLRIINSAATAQTHPPTVAKPNL